MSNAAKGGFPGCPRRKVEKHKKKNSNHRIQGLIWENSLTIMGQVKKNLHRFYEIFGDTEEEDEFHGFSSEECGLRAYKRVITDSATEIPDILCSPIDLSRKKVMTRLAHARDSLDALPLSERTRRRKKHTIIRHRHSKSEIPIVEGNDLLPVALVMLDSIDAESRSGCENQGFMKYKNSSLDFHRLSRGLNFREQSSSIPRNPVSISPKVSPIKPATFIAPSTGQHIHHVTNVTPTCLKIKINSGDGAGPGHPKVLAKALLARAGKRTRKTRTSELDQPVHTSTPIGAAVAKPKSKSFILPTKSSRSSRIIKANPKYLDSDYSTDGLKDYEAIVSPPSLIQQPILVQMSPPQSCSSSRDSPSKGRPLLKEPTFRVAALASINNKPQPTRTLDRDKGMSTRIQARKLIKRARFKHPTSSSTLVVGNDFEEDLNRKKNPIREATFKMPNQFNHHNNAAPESRTKELSDLGLSKKTWEKVFNNEVNYDRDSTLWSKQEIHNILHGANTFSNSWSSVARQYEFHPVHRDWCSMKNKTKTLQNLGLLSENRKVKSSILLQLKHRYSADPNVTVFTQKELRQRGMECNVKCDVGEKGRMLKDSGETGKDDSLKNKSPMSRHKVHVQRFNKWQSSISEDPDPSTIHLGLKRKAFLSMCTSRVNKPLWSIRELHNVLHGTYIFGAGEWTVIHNMYAFQISHNNLAIRTRYRSLQCKGLIVGGKVKKDVLPLLQPKLSIIGKEYFGIDITEQDLKTTRPSKDRSGRSETKVYTRKRNASSGSDFTSPPRKQAYHLFGTAPVWDDGSSSSGLQSLKGGSEVEENLACEQMLSSPIESKDNIRKTSNESTSSKKGKKADKVSVNKLRDSKSRGPRIKHVCRRASLVTGLKSAVYSDDGAHLSALPKEEREKIAAEAEKRRGVVSDSTMSSDAEAEVATPVANLPKQAIRKRGNPKTTTKILKMISERNNGRTLSKKTVKKSTENQKRNTAIEPPKSKRKSPTPSLPNHSALAGIILSPDSRRRLQQELHERDHYLPSIVKIDEWKERYELEDLWKMGGVGIITSKTPSTRIVCFLCGSAGKTRPMRRISRNSDSSLDSNDNYVHTPLFIICCSCCEPFHPFCLDDHEQQPAIIEAKKGIWICKRCRFCNVCGRPGDLLECRRCTKTYHSACLGPSYPTKPSKNRVWVCMRCVRCRSCGASRPGRRPGSKWTHDFELCQRCGDLFDKGNFCPICRRCYSDEDYESRMVQCATCKRWVHSRCESLTIEMYTLLSHLPDDVQYVCPDCDGRRASVELELGHSDVSLTDESGNDSLEGDKMRGLLCKLPAPSWKRILENEIQSGIETVMMGLFHNKEAACILKKSAVEEESGRPVDLFAVRFAVHNRRYTSVAEFSSDVCYILDTVDGNDSSSGLSQSDSKKSRRTNGGARGAFCQEMHNVFPWFDVYTGRVRDSSDVPEDLLPHATLPPHCDHDYAQWQDRDIDMPFGGPDTPLKGFVGNSPSKSSGIGTVIWTYSPQKEFEDMRQCLFCGKYGDDHPTHAGRLVYCGQDEWVHVNCALWSAEVFERHDGSLQNVYSAVSRGRMMKCELCKLPGATVGCNTRDCPKNYHFICAKMAQCSFQNDKKVFCTRHLKNVDGGLVPEEGFEIVRRVVVDNDEMRPNKRWQSGMNSRSVTILLGSAIIHQLGHLSTSSDSKDYLIPVHFRMTRMFWSTVHAGRRVRYTISVTEQKSPLDGSAALKDFMSKDGKMEQHENHTISHADDDEPLKSATPRKNRYRGADACRSNLLDRLHGNRPGPLPRRKSHDESVIPQSTREGRLSDGHYTVVGTCNRTLPQAITPLPSITRSANTFQRLLPSCTESTNHNTNSPDQTAVSSDKVATTYDLPQISKKAPTETDDAVLVSAQNPFLNIGIDNANGQHQLITSSNVIPSVVGDSATTIGNPSQIIGETVNARTELLEIVTESVEQTPTRFAPSLVETIDTDCGGIRSPGSRSSEKELSLKNDKDMSDRSLETVPEIVANEGGAMSTVEKAEPVVRCELEKKNFSSELEPNRDFLDQQIAAVEQNNSPVVAAAPLNNEELSQVKLEDLKPLLEINSTREGIVERDHDHQEAPDSVSSDRCSQSPTEMRLCVRIERLENSPHAEKFLKTESPNRSLNTSVSLLQQARDAVDRESATESPIVPQSIESTSLWWKKVKVQKKTPKPSGQKKGGKKSIRDNEKAKKDTQSNSDDYVMSEDDFEEFVVRPVRTRSRARSASLNAVGTPQVLIETEAGSVKNDQNTLQNSADSISGKLSSDNLTPHHESDEWRKVQSQEKYEGRDEENLGEVDQSQETDESIRSLDSIRSEAASSVSIQENDEAVDEDKESQDKDSVSLVSHKSSGSDSLLFDCAHNLSRDDSPDESSVSEESNPTALSNAPAAPRLRNLRKFARSSDMDAQEPEKITRQLKTRKSSSSRLRLRRFSHDLSQCSIGVEKQKVIQSGTCRDQDLNPDTQNLPPQNARSRSKSVDATAKKKNLGKHYSQLEDLDSEISPRRYPRRNPFTCLGSFSGLSPNYAIQSYSVIQSYSSKGQERDERATARLLTRGKKLPKRKNISPTKSPRSRSRSSSGNGTQTRSELNTRTAANTSKAKGKIKHMENKKKTRNKSSMGLAVEDAKSKVSCVENDINDVVGPKSDSMQNRTQISSKNAADCEVQEFANGAYRDPFTNASTKHDAKSSIDRSEKQSEILQRDPVKNESSLRVRTRSHSGKTRSVSSTVGPALGRTTSEQPLDKNVSSVPKVQDAATENLTIEMTCKTSKGKVLNSSGENVSENTAPVQFVNDQVFSTFEMENDAADHVVTKFKPTERSSKTSGRISTAYVLASNEATVPSDSRSNVHAGSHQDPAYALNNDNEIEGNNSSIENTKTGKKGTEIDMSESVPKSPRDLDTTATSQDTDSLPPIESTRGIIEENETAETKPAVIEPDIISTSTKQNQALQLPLPKLPTSPLALNDSLPPIKGTQTMTDTRGLGPAPDDIESPLSPRDEPRLPLPMETESFLVTSECPVLNADEVKSLLEMPSTTATSNSVFARSALPSMPASNQVQYYRSQVQQQYAVVNVPQQAIMAYPVQQNLPVVPLNRGSSGTLVMYGRNVSDCSNRRQNVLTMATDATRLSYIPAIDGKLSRQVLVSQTPKPTAINYQYVQPQFQMIYQTPVGSVVPPSMAYITTPVINTNQRLYVTQQTPYSFAYTRTSATPAQLATPQIRCTPTHAPTNPVHKQKHVRKSSKALSGTPAQSVSADAPRPRAVESSTRVEDVKLTPDQANTLEKMIDFYSNKNKLSQDEKQIVRAVIAQQIKNKSLPLPPQESLQATSKPCDDDVPKEFQGQTKRLNSVSGRKRKLSLAEPECKVKRAKKTKRKENMIQHQQPISPVAERSLGENIEDATDSPLLSVYMNVVGAENATDDKLVKKWRDAVRSLSQNNIHLDVPWNSRKGHRDKENRLPRPPQSSKRSCLMYEIKSDDGYHVKGPDFQELVLNLLDAVQECRANACMPPTSLCLSSILSSHAFLGVSHDAIRFLVEQLPGARHCLRYRAKYHKHREPPAEVVTHINPHGCARVEKYQGRSKPDMFSFLASKHRLPPSFNPSQTQNVDMQLNSTRRPTSMDLPMAMRFRHLKTSAREAVGVYRSAIHGRGLYCKRDIEAGEMVMEYTGEVIRCFLTDSREKTYEKKAIGCYMFRMDDMYVIDATVMGSGARFINHSCEPSCYSRIVTIDGKKHIIIFALRKILRGEELTYDYKFPIEAEEQKIMCNCGAKTCRKYMN